MWLFIVIFPKFSRDHDNMTRVAVLQLVSTDNVSENLKSAAELIAAASKEGAEFLQLPENFPLMGHEEQDKLSAKEARYRLSEDRQKAFQTQQAAFSLEEGALRSRMNQLRINQPIKQASLLESGLEGIKAGLAVKQIND